MNNSRTQHKCFFHRKNKVNRTLDKLTQRERASKLRNSEMHNGYTVTDNQGNLEGHERMYRKYTP